MSRYIDADKLTDDLCSVRVSANGAASMTAANCFIQGVKFAKELIEKAPTEDVALVVHARWRDRDFGIVGCTNCKYIVKVLYDDDKEDQCDFNYCPNCGAKMKEVQT